MHQTLRSCVSLSIIFAGLIPCIVTRQSEVRSVLSEIHELDQMPLASKSGAVWDLNVNIRSGAQISRLVSLNHPIAVQFADGNRVANV